MISVIYLYCNYYKAIWSPSICVFSRRINYRKIYDNRFDVYERAVTFDASEIYSRDLQLNGKVTATPTPSLYIY